MGNWGEITLLIGVILLGLCLVGVHLFGRRFLEPFPSILKQANLRWVGWVFLKVFVMIWIYPPTRMPVTTRIMTFLGAIQGWDDFSSPPKSLLCFGSQRWDDGKLASHLFWNENSSTKLGPKPGDQHILTYPKPNFLTFGQYIKWFPKKV